MAQDRGERADMFRQYLKPAMNRSNLTVLTGAKTLKIETEQHSGKPAARAVKFSTKGPAGQIHTGGCRAGSVSTAWRGGLSAWQCCAALPSTLVSNLLLGVGAVNLSYP